MFILPQHSTYTFGEGIHRPCPGGGLPPFGWKGSLRQRESLPLAKGESPFVKGSRYLLTRGKIGLCGGSAHFWPKNRPRESLPLRRARPPCRASFDSLPMARRLAPGRERKCATRKPATRRETKSNVLRRARRAS